MDDPRPPVTIEAWHADDLFHLFAAVHKWALYRTGEPAPFNQREQVLLLSLRNYIEDLKEHRWRD